MPLRVAAVLFCAFLATAADPTNTVAETITLVRNALAGHQSDSALAKSLRKLKVAEKLNDRVVEELESEGAGPKSVLELERLRDTSATLPPPTSPLPFPSGVRPSIEEQRAIINAAHEIAVNYTRSLPDFICTEVIRRFDDTRRGMDLRDTLEIKLSYFDQKEDYRLLTVNGHPTVRPLEAVGGALSQGEFGTMLLSIFSSETKTRFFWDHWTTLRKHPARVFAFKIEAANSNYHLRFGQGPAYVHADAVVGHHGFLYIDRDTSQVLRIVAAADVPPKFPVQSSEMILDYDFRPVGGKDFLLPVRAEIRMAAADLHTRNLVEFHGYRKFSGESTITFQ